MKRLFSELGRILAPTANKEVQIQGFGEIKREILAQNPNWTEPEKVVFEKVCAFIEQGLQDGRVLKQGRLQQKIQTVQYRYIWDTIDLAADGVQNIQDVLRARSEYWDEYFFEPRK